MPWAVVTFHQSDDVEAVPQKWLEQCEDGSVSCWWPPKCHKISELITKESEIRHLPGAEKFDVRVLGNNYDTVELARKKASKAQYESDLSSDQEGKQPRKRVAKALYSPSSSPTAPNKKQNSYPFYLREKDAPQPLKSLPLPPQLFEDPESLAAHFPIQRSTDRNTDPACSRLSEITSAFTPRPLKSLPLSPQLIEVPESLPSPVPIQRSTDQNTRPGCSRRGEITSALKKKKSCSHDEADSAWKEKMSNDVACIKLKVEAIYEVVTALQTAGSKNSDDLFEESQINVESILPCNPIIQEEELNNLERKLQDKKSYDFVVKELSRLGGTTTKEVTKRMLRKLFSDELAQQYSFHGFKKKKVFGTLKIKNGIFDAVRKTRSTTQSSDAEIEGVIKDWLRQAKFRLVAKNKTKCPVAQEDEDPNHQELDAEDPD